ncbi:HD domain-containing protein [Nocardiopsis ansamitocini]|uniref:5'-deoxynucleotidase n=1 Tax=Nocardiopsis ansamitocini TaxID=1670832 RepID=A0A9W6P9I4_9ACTN|nr:HD domain-containing protein [Nocardiopsis ansamitocini]GLU50110.1 haloacid dehalogenase [Nocardiopsis ansamitocini]
MADETEFSQLAGFLYETGLMKRYKRTGWHIAGINNPESIADHSFRAGVIAAALAALEGADPDRAALLALFHDTQETRITDIPYVAKRYLSATSNEEVTADQVSGLPAAVADMVGRVVGEYEAKESLEARCARDADKLECLLQAVEYRAQGNTNTQSWIDTSLAALQTTSAKRLAEEALRADSLDWMHTALERPVLPGKSG